MIGRMRPLALRRRPQSRALSASSSAEVDLMATLAGHEWGFDAGRVFTDTSGITPASADGDTVAYATDTSGNGRHLTQSTAASRPVWSRVAGRGALGNQTGSSRFMATGSFLATPSFNTSFTIYWVGERAQPDAGTLDVCLGLPSTGSGNFIGFDRTSTPSERVDFFTTALTPSATTRYRTWTSANRVAVMVRYNGTTKTIRVFSPQGEESTDYAATGNVGFTGALKLGDAPTAGFHFIGLHCAANLYSAYHDDETVDAAFAHLQTKWMAEPAAGAVSTGAGTKVVVCDGNSLTQGVGETEYPEQLATLLGAGWDLTNLGRGSYTTGMMNVDAETRVDALWDSSAAKNVCVAWEMTNDRYFNGTVLSIERRMRDYVLRRRAKGWYVIVPTILPRTGAGTPAGFEADRGTLNTWLLAGSSGANAVVDLTGNANLSDSTNVTYFNADKVHLTTAGAAEVAAAVRTAVEAA
jgi:hypothetical protein